MKELQELQNCKQIKGIIKTRNRDKRPNCPQNRIKIFCVMHDKIKTVKTLQNKMTVAMHCFSKLRFTTNQDLMCLQL